MIPTSIESAFEFVREDVAKLLAVQPVLLGKATPSYDIGVYMLLIEDKVMYAGEATGKKGLRDRLLAKHLSGDEGHTLHRELKAPYPDKTLRRAYLEANVSARWLPIDGKHRARAVERMLIWLYDPPWNRK
jgi:hypothetical protein